VRIPPITIPIIPRMLTRDRNTYPLSDSGGSVFSGISGIAELFDSRKTYGALISAPGDRAGILSRGARSVSLCRVMAKREKSRLSARYRTLPFIIPDLYVGRYIQVPLLRLHKLTFFIEVAGSAIEKRGTSNSIRAVDIDV
jgi:hypothetical protein